MCHPLVETSQILSLQPHWELFRYVNLPSVVVSFPAHHSEGASVFVVSFPAHHSEGASVFVVSFSAGVLGLGQKAGPEKTLPLCELAD